MPRPRTIVNRLPVRLLDRARSGELQLHLPVICLSEARRPILTMHRSRQGEIGEFLKWAKKQALVTANDDSGTRRVLNLLELQVKTGLAQRKEPLASLYDDAGVWVYGDFVLKWPRRPDGWPGSRV
jgi:hypothetical protein